MIIPDGPFEDLTGKLLLSSPALGDGIFDRSVIYLARHSVDEGAMGVILNQPTGHTVSKFLPQPEFKPLSGIPVHVGGPVEPDKLTFALFQQSPGGLPHLELRIPAERAIQSLGERGHVIRAYLGYSGWSAGQLENELERHSWFVMQPNASFSSLAHSPNLWLTLMSSLSPVHRLMTIAPRHVDLN